MYWRLPRSEFEAGKGAGNKKAFARLARAGPTPGLLAYVDGTVAGWCALGPRDSYPTLDRSRVLGRVDAAPVWSVVCFFIAPPYRRQGLTVALLQAAASAAAKGGAKILEGYPVEPPRGTYPSTFAWTGLASAFERAGFSEVTRRSPTRPIMRRSLSPKR